jgi:hypothetical protein
VVMHHLKGRRRVHDNDGPGQSGGIDEVDECRAGYYINNDEDWPEEICGHNVKTSDLLSTLTRFAKGQAD